jgi:hypothetical protein
MARTFTLVESPGDHSKERILLTCVRVGVSLRHAYVSHHPQHENASERTNISAHPMPPLASLVVARCVDIAPPSADRTARGGLFNLCVPSCRLETRVERRARWRSARERRRSVPSCRSDPMP